MSEPLADVRDALAVYRLTKLVIDDELLSDVRNAVFAKFPPDSTKLGYLLTCPWCASMWLAALPIVGRRVAPRAWGAVASALAASAVVGLIEEARTKL